MDPLEITILRCGTFKTYEAASGKKLRHINPPVHDVQDLVKAQDQFQAQDGRRFPL